MNDRSFNLIPERNYTPVTGLETRLRDSIPVGGGQTAYGDKQSDRRVEARLRYFC
jgi:hypothetical protein